MPDVVIFPQEFNKNRQAQTNANVFVNGWNSGTPLLDHSTVKQIKFQAWRLSTLFLWLQSIQMHSFALIMTLSINAIVLEIKQASPK